ncbi:hypothetical protein D9757_014413 [Collybiopsis confluens]|uniref:C2H2-type domain-containing protein n=1 Tax=Collybiopsis confluens TaxID=2823264 RepID=A0A8H5FNY1_9AGAR|nr:hypothetical protein D9757_014413 [Collybiopsis confluens]
MNATDTKAVVFFDERTQSVLTSEKHAETTGLFHLNTLILASSLRADSSFANSTRVDSQAPNPSSPNVNRLRPSIWISATSLSGISVWVSYEAINIPREWLDYSQVRNLETLRYLHDARPSGLNDSYRFKKGFYPVYTNIEKYLIQHRDGLTRANKCSACKKKFDSIASLMRHMRMSTKCHQKIKLTDKGQQRLRKAPRLSEDRDIADALGTDTQSNVEQNVAGPAPARTPSPVPYPPLPPPAPPPPPSLVTLRPTRSGRTRFLPARFQDNLPTLSRSMPSTFQPENPIEEPAPAPVPAPFPSPTPEPDIVLKKVRTDPDQFGIFRIYSELPKSIPDEEVPIEDVCEGAGFPVPPPADSSSIFGSVIKVSSRVKNSIIAPFLNITVWRLMSWWYNSDTKSIADLDRLVKEVIHPSDFDPSHLEGFSTDKVLKDLDNYQDDTRLFPAEDGWREISVEIPVPCRGVKQPEAKAPRYIISGIFIRKPLEVMKSTFQSSLTEKFHYTPFELRQESFPGSPSSFRLHGELYNSPAFIEEHNRVQVEQFKKGKASPENKDLQYPTALAGMMLWSDATRVGHWGDATMWPIYMYFGNQSKYDRSRPSAFAAHHIAYIPKLSEDFKGWYQEQYGCTPTEAVMTFMRREIPHAIYAELFDKDFMNAYRDGIILRCGNKVTCSMFPRLFTWSADYPEKMLLICCKCLGLHPCGECNISKDKIFRLGTVLDRGTQDRLRRQDSELRQNKVERARELIFKKGYSISSKAIDYLLGDHSWTPTRVTNQERRVRIVKSIERRLEDQQKSKAAEAENSKIQDSSNPRIPFEHEDPLPIADPTSHYQVSMTRSHRLPIMPWLDKHEDDLAVNHFLRKLRTHVFCRLTGECDEESVTPSDRGRVFINNNDRMYVHKVLRINYTTYDQRRCQDSINPRTHSDVMVLSPNDVDDDEPYLYARVIGIYHVEAGLRNDPQNSSSKRIDFLWVRWYVSADDRSCWKSRRLPQVGFVDGSDDGAFGFLDPAQVIRAVHLLPNFKEGRVSTILGPSMARRADEEDQDYQRYYINIFADRDMMIRFCPELTLGTHIASVVPDPPDSSDIEDNSDSSEEIEEEEEEQDEETLDDASHSEGESDRESIDSDRYTEGEGSDYGYDTGGSDEEDVENIEDNQFDVEPNIGPEDGEEPFNHNVEILDIEGFSAL